MKSLIGLLLTLCMAIAACSADNGPTPATGPAAAPETTETTTAEPAAVETEAAVAAEETTEPTTAEPPADVAADTTETTTVEPPAVAETSPDIADAATPVLAQVQQPAAAPAITAPAPRRDIVAGRHYRVLTPAQPTSSSPDKIEVAEMFMYSCPHCKDIEPFIDRYVREKPGYVSFVRIPASFNRIARLHSKAFYMAETLGVVDDIHMAFFDEYHNKGNRLATEQAIIDFFVSQGVARQDVTNAYNSFAVDTKIRQADNLGRRYGIDSVPTVVINGKYVTSVSMTGNSYDKLRDVIDYLTAKEAAQL